ncbi:MAG: AraC family transcriptional regulator [Blastocatellia bacterium]|nr:AraC family transcriptional regulator [Blastocatellia bacterium]
MEHRAARQIYLPVPIYPQDCLRQASVADFTFHETFHAPGCVLPCHAHERATINLLLEGSFHESFRSRTEVCMQSSILFRPAGEDHRDQFGTIGGHVMIIEVGASRLETFRSFTDVVEAISQQRDAQLEAIGQKIMQEWRIGDEAARLALEGLTLELVATASRKTKTMRPTRPIPRWLCQVRDLLHDRWEEPLLVADLAAAAEVHPVYLARAFRAHFGCTPGVYLRRVRIAWAKHQLLQGARPLSDIAFAAGFADQSHFTKVFKQETGLTPGQFSQIRDRQNHFPR